MMDVCRKCLCSIALAASLASQTPAQVIEIINADFEADSPMVSPPSGWTATAGTMYVTTGAGH